jgi:hypothetical protein
MKEAATTEARAVRTDVYPEHDVSKCERRGMFLASYSHAVAILGFDFFLRGLSIRF